jgi:hypothetical protein
MKTICFALPNNESLTKQLAARMNAEIGEAVIRHFPDGETYVRIVASSNGRKSKTFWKDLIIKCAQQCREGIPANLISEVPSIISPATAQ